MSNGKFATYWGWMWFGFSEDKLVSFIINDHGEDCSELYGENESSLKEKYGNPINSGNDYISLPTEGYDALDLYYNDHNQEVYNSSNLQIENLSQYLAPANGGYVSIMHLQYSYEKISEYGIKDKKYRAMLSYSYITEEAYNELVNAVQQKQEEEKRAREEF